MENSTVAVSSADFYTGNPSNLMGNADDSSTALKEMRETIEYQRSEIAALKAIIRRDQIEHDESKVEVVRLQHALQLQSAPAPVGAPIIQNGASGFYPHSDAPDTVQTPMAQAPFTDPMTAEEIRSCNPSKMSAMRTMFERGVRAAEQFHGIGSI